MMRKLLPILLVAVIMVIPLQMTVTSQGANETQAPNLELSVQIGIAEVQAANQHWVDCCFEGSWGCCIMWFFDELFNDY